jgi:ankyrin repeat protein
MNQGFIGKTLYEKIASFQEKEVIAIFEQNPEALGIITPIGSWLHVAARHGCLELVKYLLDSGMDINSSGGSSQSAPLNFAAGGGHLHVVDFLLQKGAGIDTSEPERNPLYAAIHAGSLDVARRLLIQGIDASIQYENSSALTFAEKEGRWDIAVIIKDYL